jgi:hypothetical protein
MHKCLLVQEILYRVVSDVENFGNKRSLSNLSLTCKRFLEPALDELWRTQANLIPLAKCFPPDSWNIREELGLNYGLQTIETFVRATARV